MCNCREVSLKTTNQDALRNQGDSFGSYYLHRFHYIVIKLLKQLTSKAVHSTQRRPHLQFSKVSIPICESTGQGEEKETSPGTATLRECSLTSVLCSLSGGYPVYQHQHGHLYLYQQDGSWLVSNKIGSRAGGVQNQGDPSMCPYR